MTSIDELMAGKQPGEIKVRYSGWHKTRWFEPYFKANGKYWCGKTDVGALEMWEGDGKGWQLWQEPREEVEVFEWLYKYDVDMWTLSGRVMTEKEAEDWFNEYEYEYRKTGRSWRVPK